MGFWGQFYELVSLKLSFTFVELHWMFEFFSSQWLTCVRPKKNQKPNSPFELDYYIFFSNFIQSHYFTNLYICLTFYIDQITSTTLLFNL